MRRATFTSTIEKLPVYLIRRMDREYGPCWYYIEVDRGRHDAFLKISDSGKPYKITDYARVISSGWGENPPQATIDLLKSEGVID